MWKYIGSPDSCGRRHPIIGAMKYSALLVLLAASLVSAQTAPNDAKAREVYKELVEINTTDTPAGNVTKAAEAVAARLKAAGFPAADIQILGPDPKKGNLVFRFPGTGPG